VNSQPLSSTASAPPPAPQPLLLRGTGVTCRVQHWSFQPTTAQLILYHHTRLPSTADLQRWSQQLRELGYTSVRTTALQTSPGLRAEAAGFHVLQELVLLEHLAPREGAAAAGPCAPSRRMLLAEHADASAVDLLAFGQGWALEPGAVADVCQATPRHRARCIGEPVSAYAITGRDGKQGFLQRLAVAPDAQRHGFGRALVQDSLQWLARWRVQRVLVNTAVDNDAALALYERLGFRRLSERLRVYERSLT